MCRGAGMSLPGSAYNSGITMTAQAQTEQQFVIHPATTLGYVHLTAADLDRQIDFYQSVLGLKVQERKDGTASLGAGGNDLLRVTGLPGARRVRGTTGLYHFAVLVPCGWAILSRSARISGDLLILRGQGLRRAVCLRGRISSPHRAEHLERRGGTAAPA